MAQYPVLLIEQARGQSVMHINRMFVRKFEFDLAKHAFSTGWLDNAAFADIYLVPVNFTKIGAMLAAIKSQVVFGHDPSLATQAG